MSGKGVKYLNSNKPIERDDRIRIVNKVFKKILFSIWISLKKNIRIINPGITAYLPPTKLSYKDPNIMKIDCIKNAAKIK